MHTVSADPSLPRGNPPPILSGLLVLALAGPVWAADSPSAPESGVLSVASDPTGAVVYLDGEPKGATPLNLHSLQSGDHRLRVVKEGFLEKSRILSVRSGQSYSLQVRLTPEPASIRRSVQVEEKDQGKKKGGGKKALWIGLGALAAGGITYALIPKNEAPTAGTIGVSPSGTGLMAVTSFTFTAQGASDPDGDPLTYSWNFGDGGTGSGQTTTRVYSTAGSFSVTLTVSDGKKSATAPGASVTVKNLSGTWRGSISGFPFTFTLTQNGTSITGSYSDADGPGTVSGGVSAPRSVSLTVNQPGFLPFTFSGVADAELNAISGTVFGLSFTMSR